MGQNKPAFSHNFVNMMKNVKKGLNIPKFQKQLGCPCNQHPYLQICPLFLKMPLHDRLRELKSRSLCKLCFNKHQGDQCQVKFIKNCNCEELHNILVCPQKIPTVNPSVSAADQTSSQNTKNNHMQVFSANFSAAVVTSADSVLFPAMHATNVVQSSHVVSFEEFPKPFVNPSHIDSLITSISTHDNDVPMQETASSVESHHIAPPIPSTSASEQNVPDEGELEIDVGVEDTVPASVSQSDTGLGGSSCEATLTTLKNGLVGTACPFCTHVFDTNIQKLVHILYSHYSTYTKQACQKCGEHVDDMIMHMSVRHNLKGLHCPTCFLPYASEPSLVRHFKQLHILTDEPPPRITCPACLKVFTKFTNMQTHFEQRHTVNPTRYPCEFCPQTFSQKSSRVNHIDRVHKLCQKLYIKKVTHIRNQHKGLLPVDVPEAEIRDTSFNPFTRARTIFHFTSEQPMLPPSQEIVFPPVSATTQQFQTYTLHLGSEIPTFEAPDEENGENLPVDIVMAGFQPTLHDCPQTKAD